MVADIEGLRLIEEADRLNDRHAIQATQHNIASYVVAMDQEPPERRLMYVAQCASILLGQTVEDADAMRYPFVRPGTWHHPADARFNDTWTPNGREHWASYLDSITSLENVLPERLVGHSGQSLDDLRSEAALMHVATGNHPEAHRLIDGTFHPVRRAHSFAQSAAWSQGLGFGIRETVGLMEGAYQAFADYNELVQVRAAGMHNHLAPTEYPEQVNTTWDPTPQLYYNRRFGAASGSGYGGFNSDPAATHGFERRLLLAARAQLALSGDGGALESLRVDPDLKESSDQQVVFLGMEGRSTHHHLDWHADIVGEGHTPRSTKELWAQLQGTILADPGDITPRGYRWKLLTHVLVLGKSMMGEDERLAPMHGSKYTLPPAPTQATIDERIAHSRTWADVGDLTGAGSEQSLEHALQVPYSPERTELLAAVALVNGIHPGSLLVTGRAERANYNELARQHAPQAEPVDIYHQDPLF